MKETAFPRRHRVPSTEKLTNADGFPAKPGDLLVARSNGGALNKIISKLHGFFTHSAIVVEVDCRDLPTVVSHAYGAGLITQNYDTFKKDYETIAVARFDDSSGAAEQALQNTVKKEDLTPGQRVVVERLLNNASKDPAPESDSIGDGYGFSGYDLGLAGVISARARLRDLGWMAFDNDLEWVEDQVSLSSGDHRFSKDPRKLESRVTKRFTCAGHVLNVYRKEYGFDVIQPAFLENVYREGDWVFDTDSQTLSYQGPSTFSLDHGDSGIGELNLLNAFGIEGWDERGWTFDADDPNNKKLVDQFVESLVDLGINEDIIKKALTQLETFAVSGGTARGAFLLKSQQAFTVQTVVGPCDLWESPRFLEERGFICGAEHYFDYVARSERWREKLAKIRQALEGALGMPQPEAS